MRRFLHDVTQLSGQHQIALAVHAGCFDKQDVAAHWRPGQAGGDAGFRGPLGHLGQVLLRAQEIGHAGHGDGLFLRGLFFRHQHGHRSNHVGQFTLEVAHARLARVAVDNLADCGILENHALTAQAVLVQLLLDEELLGDVQLLFAGVARNLQHLKPIAQCRWNRVEDVGCGDEHDLGKIEGNFQIVVRKGVVLLGVQDFQQGRGRIPAKVVPQFVDFVEHEHRVVRSRLLHALHDSSWQRPDVGTAVTTDLGLVAYPSQRHPHELAAQGASDGLAQRGLAHSGRAHQAEDRPLLVGFQLAHRQIFQDALLDLLQVVVVGVQDVASRGDVELVLGRDGPRQLDQPFQIGTRHRVLGRRRLHDLEAF